MNSYYKFQAEKASIVDLSLRAKFTHILYLEWKSMILQTAIFQFKIATNVFDFILTTLKVGSLLCCNGFNPKEGIPDKITFKLLPCMRRFKNKHPRNSRNIIYKLSLLNTGARHKTIIPLFILTSTSIRYSAPKLFSRVKRNIDQRSRLLSAK